MRGQLANGFQADCALGERHEAGRRPVTRHAVRLVTCGPGDDPSEAQEQAATELSPRRTLREAGVADGSSLLACFAAARRSGSGSPGAPSPHAAARSAC